MDVVTTNSFVSMLMTSNFVNVNNTSEPCLVGSSRMRVHVFDSEVTDVG